MSDPAIMSTNPKSKIQNPKSLDTSKLRKFAQYARTALLEQVGVRLKTVLAEGSLARRESEKAVDDLEKEIKLLAADDGVAAGQQRMIEKAAYTWFNRFCALRYMDVNRYTKIGVISPADGQFQPEILAEAKMGHMDEDMIPVKTQERINRLLDETDPSDDPQGEAYRLLLVAACNHYHSLMPTMFQTIADYTELLLPDDLLSGNSIPAFTREALLPINCSPEHTDESVEVIGWLYQFYIGEKKDDVFAALKKGKKITPENIPAATQLFTPHWIVRYLVENSLGRLWMLNFPNSKLREKMEYYIEPEQPADFGSAILDSGLTAKDSKAAGLALSPAATNPKSKIENPESEDFLQIDKPEEIKICDPACGSGHMLTYAFDLLYAIYEEQGYQAKEIPRLILENNLYGVEIDERAGALASFALTMKAREKDPRYFNRKSIQNPKSRIQNPHVCVLENIDIHPDDLAAYMEKVGAEHFENGIQGVINQWKEAKNFGSLIRPLVTDLKEAAQAISAHKFDGSDKEALFQNEIREEVLKALRQADYLSPKYHVVVANPPYMGGRNSNSQLKDFAKRHFDESKSDLFAMFIKRNLDLALDNGLISMITMQSWMFLSSFKALRKDILNDTHVLSMAHLGPHAFDTIGGEVVATTSFVLENASPREFAADFLRLVSGKSESEKDRMLLECVGDQDCEWRFRIPTSAFAPLPDSPFAYWADSGILRLYSEGGLIGDIANACNGMNTTNNDKFVRSWWEVSNSKTGINIATVEASINSRMKWFPYNKGGGFRKWYGNNHFVVNYENGGKAVCDYIDYESGSKVNSTGRVINRDSYFKRSITWSSVTSTVFSSRCCEPGFVFDNGGSSVFCDDGNYNCIAAFLGSRLAFDILRLLNPTLNFQPGNLESLPISIEKLAPSRRVIDQIVTDVVALSKEDWDSREDSWDFTSPELTMPFSAGKTNELSVAYSEIRRKFDLRTAAVKRLEDQNNNVFAKSYSLTSYAGVPLPHVSVNCNPYYRYDSDKDEPELEALLLADTMREFISYAVGCMLGRYSLDKPGLILANAGETADDYRKQIPKPTFAPDEDNVIPLLEGEWFEDDITERFKKFLKVTFGEDNYEENLTFLEDALFEKNKEGKKRKTIRDYFLKEFYTHHTKLYKKRPIYWLFSSKHTGCAGAFNAIIYMHRYRPDTVSTVLQYLRDLRDKLSHHADHQQMISESASSTGPEKTKALKEITSINKDIKELDDYERKVLFPLAQEKVEIDLDDGVKVNYNKFGKALKKITGVTGKA